MVKKTVLRHQIIDLGHMENQAVMTDLVDSLRTWVLQISFSIDVIGTKLFFVSSMLLLSLIWMKKR
jgi:hypothetical protein